MNAVNWGDVPTWLAAAFAGGAALFAYLTIKSQREQIGEQRQFIAEQSANLELERAELRAAAEDRKWAQARQVRMHQRMDGGQPDGEGGLTGDPDHWIVTVTNPSDAPVHDVEVRFGNAYLADEVYEWFQPANPSDWRGRNGDRLTRPVHLLGPGRAAKFFSQSWAPPIAHNSRPSLTFTDDSGLRWMLDSYGKLSEAPEEPGS